MVTMQKNLKVYIMFLFLSTFNSFSLLSMFSTPRYIQKTKNEELSRKKVQRQKQCYDLIMILDSLKTEKLSHDRQAMSLNFISALIQKNFPIIVSTNIVSNVCIQVNNPESTPLSKDVATSYTNLTKVFSNLTNADWDAYMHPQSDILLFVPKKYSALFSSIADTLPEKMKACGFNVTHLKHIEHLSSEALLEHIPKQDPFKNLSIIASLESLFVMPQYNSRTWNIYLTGHGLTNHSIAGLKPSDFLNLLACFQKIKCSFLHYCSCYSGGFNRDIVQKELSQLKVNFIISAQGINEETTYQVKLPSSSIPFAFTNFFKMTEFFFGNQMEFIHQKKSNKNKQKDPIASIVSTVINKNKMTSTQPFVYIPSIGVFKALRVDKSIKIITETLAKAHIFEGKNIELIDDAISAVIIYPPYIPIPVTIKNNISLAFPTQTEPIDIHIFEKMTYQDTLASMICNCASLNRKTKTIVLAIKELHCFNYPSSELDNNEENGFLIKNMIIQINNVDKAGTRITVLFNMNDQTYYLAESFKKISWKKFNKALLDSFTKKNPQEISSVQLIKPKTGDLLYDFLSHSLRLHLLAPSQDTQRTLADIIALLESKINPTTHVQQIGALKKVLIHKQQTVLEKEINPLALTKKKQVLSKKAANPVAAYATHLQQLQNKAEMLAPLIEDITKQADLKNVQKTINAEYSAAILQSNSGKQQQSLAYFLAIKATEFVNTIINYSPSLANIIGVFQRSISSLF